MKSLLFRLIVFSSFILWFPSMVYSEVSEAVKTIKIESILHKVESEAKESITFALSAPGTAKIFTLAGEKPRLVIDFPDAGFFGKNSVPVVGGQLAKAIRIGIHQKPSQKIRVVVDLSKEIEVRYNQVYSEDKKTLVITLLPVEIVKNQEENVEKLPAREELEKRPFDQKPVPPVFSVKEKDEKETPPVVTRPVKAVLPPVTIAPPTETADIPPVTVAPPTETADIPPVTVAPPTETADIPPVTVTPQPATTVPTILDVTFDDSSNRGEMVLLRLNDFYPPTVSAIEKDTPRVLCEFSNMKLGQDVQSDISANGKYVERIRTQRDDEAGGVKVILDLSPDRDYDLQQVFFKNDNLFVLIVNELSIQKDALEGSLQN